MANATAKVPVSTTPWGNDIIKRPLSSGAATYYPGTMMAMNATGKAVKCTNTAGLTFDGILADSQSIEVESTDATGDKVASIERPYRFVMSISDSVTDANIGAKVYAYDDQTVSLTGSASIFVGWIDDVLSSSRVSIQPRFGGTLAAESFDGNTLTFDGATGVNVIVMPDNLADGLSIKEGSNSYLTFNTADSGGESILVKKRAIFSDNVNLTFGTDADIYVAFDNTDLDILSITDDEVIKFGNGTNSFDLWFYGNNATDYLLWDASANSLAPVGNASIRMKAITDPGNAGAISNVASGYVPIVTAAAETRTLDLPSFVGQELLIYMKTDMGNGVLTVTGAVNEAGNNTVTFSNTGETIRLIGVEQGAGLVWRAAVADPATILSTV